MSTNYEVYYDSVTRLVATLVLKDETTCEIINSRLKVLGREVDEQRPETWKYYLNLAGLPHITNRPMTVVSMDDRTTIEFTRDNMDIHIKTRRDYQYGSRFYDELIEKYPEQEMLINGILNPVDITAAIAADDHSILYYDPSLVEARETNLIPLLQEWITGVFVRWANTDYRINNPLFIAARLMILFMAMPTHIMNLRTDNCRTIMAHSYHIRRYLGSFGPLDQYYTEMSEFQRLYFYRDIRSLRRNCGKNETFSTLTKNVLTRRRLPLAEYVIQQNDANIPTDFQPATQFLRRSLNGIPAALGEDIKNTDQMLYMQRSIARDNEDESPYASIYVPEANELNQASVANTKVLESNVLDLKESEPYTLAEVLLNHWIFLADQDRYTAVVELILPNGGETSKISMKDAWVLYQYLYMLRSGWKMEVIPAIMAKRVRRLDQHPDPAVKMPTWKELRGICSYKMVDDEYVTEALRRNPVIDRYVSIDTFVLAMVDVHQRMLRHRDLYVWRNDFYQYGEIKQMTDRIYMDYPVNMYKGQRYDQWLVQRNINLDGFTPIQIDAIMESLLSQATGKGLRLVQSLKDVHQAMIGIMSQLSSYSVQFIQEINEEAVQMFDWPHLRYHYMGGSAASDVRLKLLDVKPRNLQGRGKSIATFDPTFVGIQNAEIYTSHQTDLTIGLDFDLSIKREFIPAGLTLGANVTALSLPGVDLSKLLTGQKVDAYITFESRPIAGLFDKVITNDFSAP